MPTAPAVVRSRFKWHTRATWSAREDRIPALVWLALIWFGIIAGFGVDMPRFLHESPPPAPVVGFHAVAFTVWLLLLSAQVLLVVGDRVALHRSLGWRAGPALWLSSGFGRRWLEKRPMTPDRPVPSSSQSTLVRSLHLSFLCSGVLHSAGIPQPTSGS
jgi:hypothetical protein